MAGIVAGNALAGEALTTGRALRLATDIEGHPDNAAAALLGGFVVVGRRSGTGPSRRSASTPRATCGRCCSSPTCVSPQGGCAQALPETVPLADAVANLGAVALGVAGLATGRDDLLSWTDP